MSLSRYEIAALVSQTLVEEFEVDAATIAPTRRLREDLKLDSLDLVDLIVALEQRFNIRFTDEHAQTLFTLDEVYDAIVCLLAPASTR